MRGYLCQIFGEELSKRVNIRFCILYIYICQMLGEEYLCRVFVFFLLGVLLIFCTLGGFDFSKEAFSGVEDLYGISYFSLRRFCLSFLE